MRALPDTKIVESSEKETNRGSLFLRTVLLVFIVVICGALAFVMNDNQPARASDMSESILVSTASGLITTPTSTSEAESESVQPSTSVSLMHGSSLIYSARTPSSVSLWSMEQDGTRSIPLTDDQGDDRFPAVSPDGTSLAFSSNRGGYWDIYLLDLISGDLRQVTSTPGYEGQVSWSPDGMWLVYEAYYGEDFDIWILSIDGSQSPLQLTDHPGADYSPTWDPGGRRIVFVSDRDGSPDLFLADLDRAADPFVNLTKTPAEETSPIFHPTEAKLAFAYRSGSTMEIRLLDLDQPGFPSRILGSGTVPFWSPNGFTVYGIIRSADRDHIAGYGIGEIDSRNWSVNHDRLYEMAISIRGSVGEEGLSEIDQSSLFVKELEVSETDLSRAGLVELVGVNPKGIKLSDHADEAFEALRVRAAQETGWSFLDNLDNGFVGLNDPLPPGFAFNDWLYTGRAFAFSRAFFQAGWVEIVREDFAGDTYWRVYVRAELQDGSLGMPLRSKPWDFLARYEGDPNSYDQGGGNKEQIPTGYYVDFTEIAADFGFLRQPALSNWRTFYHGARYNEFVFEEGLDWTTAMLQLYPVSAIATPTVFLTPTFTPTKTPYPTATPWWWQWRTPTPSEVAATETPSGSGP